MTRQSTGANYLRENVKQKWLRTDVVLIRPCLIPFISSTIWKNRILKKVERKQVRGEGEKRRNEETVKLRVKLLFWLPIWREQNVFLEVGQKIKDECWLHQWNSKLDRPAHPKNRKKEKEMKKGSHLMQISASFSCYSLSMWLSLFYFV